VDALLTVEKALRRVGLDLEVQEHKVFFL